MRDVLTRPAARWVMMWISGTMLLMVVTVLNGYPLFFNDTRAYVRGPALGLQAVIKRDVAPDWQTGNDVPAANTQAALPPQATAAKVENNGITANRSIYYGVLPFLGYLAGDFWFTALLQSAWLAASILLVIGEVFDRPSVIYYPSMIAVALFSTAGFYTGFMMPDVFAPIMILLTSLLFLRSGRMRLSANQFAVCKYKDRFPMYWEQFIGNADPDKGVFAVADLDTRRQLSSEQIPFALAVFRFDPVGLTLGLTRDAISQLFRFSLDDFIVDRAAMANYESRFPAGTARHIARSAVHRVPDVIIGLSKFYTFVVVIAVACILALVTFYRKEGRLAQHRDEVRLAGLLCTGVVVNGVICGMLASPYDRFQARVVWLVVLAASVMVAKFFTREARHAATGASVSHATVP